MGHHLEASWKIPTQRGRDRSGSCTGYYTPGGARRKKKNEQRAKGRGQRQKAKGKSKEQRAEGEGQRAKSSKGKRAKAESEAEDLSTRTKYQELSTEYGADGVESLTATPL